jgi:hypothetical protein
VVVGRAITDCEAEPDNEEALDHYRRISPLLSTMQTTAANTIMRSCNIPFGLQRYSLSPHLEQVQLHYAGHYMFVVLGMDSRGLPVIYYRGTQAPRKIYIAFDGIDHFSPLKSFIPTYFKMRFKFFCKFCDGYSKGEHRTHANAKRSRLAESSL